MRHFGLQVLFFLALAAATVSSSRVGGGVALMWVAGAYALACLLTRSRRQWAQVLGAFAVGSFVATAWFGIGLAGALPMALINAAEPLLAALLLRRWHPRGTYFESGHGIACFAGACLVAPAITGLAGALCVAALTGTPFIGNLINWVLGHGLGMLTFTPLFMLLLRGEFLHWSRASTAAQRLEGGLLLAIVTLSCVAAFAQNVWPLGFLPILALTLATFRLGRLGAAVSVIIVALIGGWFTLRGMGPTTYIQSAAADRVHYFQLYMAAAVLTILPVAADLKQRKRLYETLRDSEARFRLVTENSTDIILNIDADGTIRYVSPAIASVGGYAPERLVGTLARRLVCEEDWSIVWAAHQAALRSPGRTITTDHRGLTAAGEMRWFETRSRAVLDEAGQPNGIVSSIRDITDRKANEVRLTQAASTDPLTGLANRRGFEGRLHAMLEHDRSRAGCLAVFDIDHFKSVNDRFGHDAGDAVIVAFAELAQSITRAGDLVARLGGEEFGILLADVTAADARALCDHLRQTLSETRVPTSSGEVRITVSAGLVDLRDAVDASTAFRAADAALYRAKAEGRDRLRLAA